MPIGIEVRRVSHVINWSCFLSFFAVGHRMPPGRSLHRDLFTGIDRLSNTAAWLSRVRMRVMRPVRRQTFPFPKPALFCLERASRALWGYQLPADS
jgi:hypothetical protein